MKKIINNIYPYIDEKLNCFERPIYTYINWREQDPSYLGLAAWSFTHNYVKNFEGIQKNIPMLWILNAVKYIYNIELLITYIVDINEAIRVVTRELEMKKPVMIYVDSYYCPWYPSYYKSHINHYVLVVGVTMDNNFIYLDKASEKSEYKILPIVDYLSGRKNGEIVLFRESYKKIDVQYKANLFLEKQLNIMKKSNLFENIRKYSLVIKEDFNIEEELLGVHDYRVASVYTWLKGISTSRVKFAHALGKCIIDLQNNCVSELEDVSDQWKNILIQLMLAKDRNVDVDYIAESIMELANREENCFNMVLQYVKERK